MDILDKYSGGTGKPGESPPADTSIFDKFLQGVKTTQPEQVQAPVERDYRPKPGEPVTGPVDIRNPAVQDIMNAPAYVARQTVKNFKESRQLAGQGITNIMQNNPATGVGETALGGLGMLVALPGAVVQGADRFVKKATGNPKAAPVELLTTTGLQIAKVGSATVAAMPSTRAVNEIIKLVGKENIPKVIDELRSNPRLALMDVSPNVQNITQGLGSQPGKPLDILKGFSEGRKQTQKGTVIEAYDEALGVPPSMKQTIDNLKKGIKDAGKEINPVIAASKPVDITPVIASIDAKLKPGVQSVITAGQPLPGIRVKEELAEVRKYLTDDKSNRTGAQELHSVQSALRARAENLLNSQSGQDREVGYALMNVRSQIVDAIDAASPQVNGAGSFKPALAKYRDAHDIDDAFQKGLLITRNKLGRLEDHPEYWAEWIKNASDAEKKAAQEGARLAVAHQMNAFRFSARKGMEIPEAEFNAEKLKLLFGEKEVNKLMKALSDERKITDTDTKIFQGSQTAQRRAAQIATQIREDWKPNSQAFLPAAADIGVSYMTGGGSTGLVASGIIGYQLARKAGNKLGQKLDKDTNIEIANLASATGEAKENLIKALQGALPQNKLTFKQKVQLALPGKP